MGDSTCLMQPFSYASGIPNEAFEGNPIHALGHSVSFGRFMTDSLAWEKWSSFSHNRYVEEAERYAQPGSVAQKKAFFEAHYKKVAAQRAAALLEQANAAAAKSNNATPPKPQVIAPDPPKYMICEQELREKVKQRNGLRSKVGLDKFESIEMVKLADLVAEEEAEDKHREEAVLVDTSGYNSSIDPQREEGAVFVDTSGYNSSIDMENCEKVHPISEFPVPGENSDVAEFSTPMQETYTHNVETVMELEHSGTLQMEKPLLQESRSSDQEASLEQNKTLFSSKSSLMYHKAPKAPISPSKTTAPCFPRREGNATPLHKACKAPTFPSKLTTPCFPRRESNATPLLKAPKAPASPSKPTPSCFPGREGAIPLHKERKGPTSPAKSTASCFPRREGNAIPSHKARNGPASPAKPTASCFPRREGNATPLHKMLSSASEDKKSSTPKSLQKSVSFTPIRELSRFTSTVMRKIENSRVGTSSFKTPKDCSTLLKTPTMVSKNEVHNHPSVTPCSGKRRAKTPGDPSSVTGAKTLGPKWHTIRTDCSKILSACRNKARSPFSSASFSLRTEERAASRKKKLEEKFNADEAQQVQEKAEIEIRKFRQSLCFKARPLPDFYKERKAPHKDEVLNTNSQTVAKKHSPRGAISVPPHDPSFKSSGSKHVQIQARNKETPTCSLITRSLKTVHENTSPNIQSS
ncbi:PREDICTED: 104 kDa microneme/rhoptry antigen isoform X2 [Fragaria vesca subsp. vesca]|uniref:104 kDa microneme/rhoptry antigen isoform X2 n=1 Tax=Fragaria vesca subsp. vesca TaxID=101020 RepID=UPI0002C36BCC|nr:PREDICTED: 104 kDa microneme/rhoptry antigen isoform X2 [Fragaria vesca subsp. vesca]